MITGQVRRNAVLSVVDVALQSLEERLNNRRREKISGAAYRSDIEHGLGWLREKLEITPAITLALDDFEEAAMRLAERPDHGSQRAIANRAFRDSVRALRRLRRLLQEAAMPYATRNEALTFARHTRRNLEHILAHSSASDLHPVTQVTLSLLGLVVFPVEKTLEAAVDRTPLEELEDWPPWRMSLGGDECRTLGELTRRLRNAVAHRHIMFSSDSRDLAEVVIEFEDYKPDAAAPHWRADIRADQLLAFCAKFADYIDATIG